MKISTLNIILAIVAIFGLSSCNIKEDMSDCPGYILLDYSNYPDEVLEDIDPDEMVNIYIFDKGGICCDVITNSYGTLESLGFQLTLPMEYNGLDVVVWHGNDSEDYEISMGLGQSYDDFYLELETLADYSFESVPSPLWASDYQTIEYCAAITRHRIMMVRIHTEVNVAMQIRSYDGSTTTWGDMQEYVVSIEVANDHYHTDYEIDIISHAVTYNNMEQVMNATSYLDWGNAGTLRITTDLTCMLYIRDLDGNLIYSLDLKSYMLMTKDNSAYTDQQFLDLNKIWDIIFILDEAEPTPDPTPDPEPEPDPEPDPTPDPEPDVDEDEDDGSGYILIGLTINGWTTWFDTVDLNGEQNYR